MLFQILIVGDRMNDIHLSFFSYMFELDGEIDDTERRSVHLYPLLEHDVQTWHVLSQLNCRAGFASHLGWIDLTWSSISQSFQNFEDGSTPEEPYQCFGKVKIHWKVQSRHDMSWRECHRLGKLVGSTPS